MKRLLIGMLLVLAVAGCASRRSYMDGVYDTLPYDFHRYIKGYFYEYLRYPDIDELFAYCWGITNSANEYVYKSYDEFDARIYGPANVAGPEPLLGYIHKKRTLLCLREHKGDLQILLNSKVMQVEHFDVCAMQKDWGNDWDFFLLHDSAGVRMNGCPFIV